MSDLKDRIARMRSGGLDGPSPTGLLLSIARTGNALIVVDDLGLKEESTVSIAAGCGAIRIIAGETIVLQTTATNDDIASLMRAPRIDLMEMAVDGEPLRLFQTRLDIGR